MKNGHPDALSSRSRRLWRSVCRKDAVIASVAWQSSVSKKHLDCHATLAMTACKKKRTPEGVRLDSHSKQEA
jgi:hypothetical protein